MDKKITLTTEELEEIKDEIKFRIMVILQLKTLKNIPRKVLKLETKVAMIMWGVPIILVALGLFLKVLIK